MVNKLYELQTVKHIPTYLNNLKNCDKLPQLEKYDVTGILVLEERVMKELENNIESHCICVSGFIA